MRARRREINIFNMSLLDILCGALGAFCFMMLVALPYYKPGKGSVQLREEQEKTQELMRNIEIIIARMSDPSAAAEMENLLRGLQAQIQTLQGQVNHLTAENEQLTATNDKQKRTLAQKKPFLMVTTATDETQDLDLYLQDDLIMEGGTKSANSPFDPMKAHHASGWRSDSNAYVPGRGVVLWVTGDVPADAHYKVYAKLANEPGARKNTIVKSSVFGDFGKLSSFTLPEVTLTPQRFWALTGTFTVDPNNVLTFKEATAAERDAEWKAITKSAPPPIAPPAATASPATTMSKAEMDALRARAEKLRREREAQRQQSPSSPASPKP
jgi:hypothetical protein